MKSTKLLIFFCVTFGINSIIVKPTEAQINNNETSNEDSSVPTERIFVDVNRIEQETGLMSLINNMNLTMVDLKRMQAEKRGLKSTSTTQSDGTVERTLSQLEEMHKARKENALSIIKETIESNIIRNGTPNDARHRGETHEIAFTPVCELPKNTSEFFWFETNTWNLYFKPPPKQMMIVSANLRLFKMPVAVDSSLQTSNGTTEDPLLRITVSAYARKKNRANGSERKKRICSCTSVASSFEGWIEMDIKLALKMWEKPSKNLGLAIEVQDSEDNHLMALSYFHRHDCEAKYPTLPFNVYRDQVFGATHQVANMPRYPRIDITYGMHDGSGSHIYHPLYKNTNPFRLYRNTPSEQDSESERDSDEHVNHRVRAHHQHHHNIAAHSQNTQHASQEHSTVRRSHSKRHLSHKHSGKRAHGHKSSGSHQEFSSDVQENT